MIRKCGRDSKVPVIMAVDALAAGIDTTGNTGKMAALFNVHQVQRNIFYVKFCHQYCGK
jgi:hypothetical protein